MLSVRDGGVFLEYFSVKSRAACWEWHCMYVCSLFPEGFVHLQCIDIPDADHKEMNKMAECILVHQCDNIFPDHNI